MHVYMVCVCVSVCLSVCVRIWVEVLNFFTCFYFLLFFPLLFYQHTLPLFSLLHPPFLYFLWSVPNFPCFCNPLFCHIVQLFTLLFQLSNHISLVSIFPFIITLISNHTACLTSFSTFSTTIFCEVFHHPVHHHFILLNPGSWKFSLSAVLLFAARFQDHHYWSLGIHYSFTWSLILFPCIFPNFL